MVRTWPHLWDRAKRAGFKFPIFQNSETDASHVELGVVNADALFDWGRVERVGEIPRLLALNHFDERRWVHISAVGRAALSCGFCPTFTPEVAVTDVMVVGDTNRRAIFHQVLELHTELEPTKGGFVVHVVLVTGKEK